MSAQISDYWKQYPDGCPDSKAREEARHSILILVRTSSVTISWPLGAPDTIPGKLREGIMATKRQDGFASEGSSFSVAALRSLAHPDSLRDVPTDLYHLFFGRQYCVNSVIPASDLLYPSAVIPFAGYNDSDNPLISAGLFLSLTTRLLQLPSGVSCVGTYFAQFTNSLLVGFSCRGDSIV